MHSFLKIILLCAQSIPTVLSIKIPSWITNPQVQGPVKNAKLRSYKIPKLFEIINWSFLLNGIVCDCVLFFRVLHHRETVLYHLVQLKPSKSYELRAVIPFYTLNFVLCEVNGGFVVSVRLLITRSSSKPQMSQSFCLWAGHLMTTLPLVNHEYK